MDTYLNIIREEKYNNKISLRRLDVNEKIKENTKEEK